MLKATCTCDNTTASRKRTRTKRYSEESWQAERHTPNAGVSPKATAICLKRQVYNSCVLPTMTYGTETWTLTKQAQNKLAAAQIKMERSMFNITYKTRNTNIWVRERAKVIYYNQHCEKNEMVLGRAYQRHQRRPMDIACHHLQM